jgi:hypothetical protein
MLLLILNKNQNTMNLINLQFFFATKAHNKNLFMLISIYSLINKHLQFYILILLFMDSHFQLYCILYLTNFHNTQEPNYIYIVSSLNHLNLLNFSNYKFIFLVSIQFIDLLIIENITMLSDNFNF